MVEKTKELVNNLDALMGLYTKRMLNPDTIKYLDEESVIALKSSMNVFDCYKDLVLKQAEIIDEMNRKLDKLLVKAEA